MLLCNFDKFGLISMEFILSARSYECIPVIVKLNSFETYLVIMDLLF